MEKLVQNIKEKKNVNSRDDAIKSSISKSVNNSIKKSNQPLVQDRMQQHFEATDDSHLEGRQRRPMTGPFMNDKESRLSSQGLAWPNSQDCPSHETWVNIAATYIRFFFESVFVTKCHFFFESKKKIFFHFFYSKKNENFFIFFDSKKIVAFAFHFLSDFSRQSKSKISFFRSWKFWVEKIFSFAFHFLWDLRSEIFSFAFHFLEDFLFYLFIDLACLKFASKVKIEKNQISEIQIQLIFST